MAFKLTMRTANAAFCGEMDEEYGEQSEAHRNLEIARILRDAADRIENGKNFGNLYDINGNTVGDWETSDD